MFNCTIGTHVCQTQIQVLPRSPKLQRFQIVTSQDNLTPKVIIDLFNKSSQAQESEEHHYLITTSIKSAARPEPSSTLAPALSLKH